jgi:hypothetical protein
LLSAASCGHPDRRARRSTGGHFGPCLSPAPEPSCRRHGCARLRTRERGSLRRAAAALPMRHRPNRQASRHQARHPPVRKSRSGGRAAGAGRICIRRYLISRIASAGSRLEVSAVDDSPRWTTARKVKLLLPTRQSWGNSHFGLGSVVQSTAPSFKRLLDRSHMFSRSS